MHILVDGYNYLCAIRGAGVLRSLNLDMEREKLIETFALYRRYRHNPVTLVFDGEESPNLYRSSSMHAGVKVIYSAQGEKADDVIMEMVQPMDLVVTADRQIISSVQRQGAEFITPRDFSGKLEMLLMMQGNEKDETDDYDDSPITTKKKGNPKRRSKADRRKNRFLRNI